MKKKKKTTDKENRQPNKSSNDDADDTFTWLQLRPAVSNICAWQSIAVLIAYATPNLPILQCKDFSYVVLLSTSQYQEKTTVA